MMTERYYPMNIPNCKEEQITNRFVIYSTQYIKSVKEHHYTKTGNVILWKKFLNSTVALTNFRIKKVVCVCSSKVKVIMIH